MSRPKIAYFSPFPPTRSGIADYSSELLPYLAKHADITLFSDELNEVGGTLSEQFAVYPLEQYSATRWQYDMPLYQMGNSTYHEAIYQMFLRYPGLVTLHDYSLSHFMQYRTIGNNRMGSYMRELGYGLGSHGLEQARRSRLGEGLNALPTPVFIKRLLDLSLGLIVHSQYVKDLISTQNSEVPVSIIPHQMSMLSGESYRSQLSWPHDAAIFTSIGQVTMAKQIELALRAFHRVHQENPNTYYLIVGEEMGDMDLSSIIHSLNLSDSVKHIGYIADKQEFINWIYTADIIVNLRFPTIGETSGTALRSLAIGRPLILFDHGWYSELPNSACIKIPVLDEAALFSAMLTLVQDRQKRSQLGEAGRIYIKEHNHPDQSASAYAAFLKQQIYQLTINDGT